MIVVVVVGIVLEVVVAEEAIGRGRTSIRDDVYSLRHRAPHAPFLPRWW